MRRAAGRIRLAVRHPQPTARERRGFVGADEADLLPVRVEHPQHGEDVTIGARRGHPQPQPDRPGELGGRGKRLRGEVERAPGRVELRRPDPRPCRRRQPGCGRIEVEPGPLRARQRPLVLQPRGRGAVGMADRQPHRRLVRPAVVEALQGVIEEALLQGAVFRQVEALEMRADMHRQPLPRRAGTLKALDVAAQMHAGATPIARRQHRHPHIVQHRHPLGVPGVGQRVLEHAGGIVHAVARQQRLGQRRPGQRGAGFGIAVAGGAVAMLVDQDLARPPGGGEAVARDAAVMAEIAVVVAAAFPGYDGGEVRRLQGGHQPLRDGEVGHADEADPAARPWLRRRPLDGLVEVADFARRIRIQQTRRHPAAAAVDLDHDIAVGHPALRIDGLPAQVLPGRAVLAQARIGLQQRLPLRRKTLGEMHVLAVDALRHQHRVAAVPRRAKHVGAQHDAVRHRDRDVLVEDQVHGKPSRYSAAADAR